MVVASQPEVLTLFAQWLRRRRGARDLSAETLADMLGSGASPEAVLDWESARGRPSRRMAERLARIFAIPHDEHRAFVLFAISDLYAPDDQLSDAVAPGPDFDPDAPWRARPQPPSNLPTLLTTFVGREAEVERVAEYMGNPGLRLLTLLGPPGIGKTRLSIEAARCLLSSGDYEDGVFFVPLAALTDGPGIAQAIASALGVKESTGRPAAEVLVDYLRDKRLLLVLDNLEQIKNVSTPLADLLTTAPHIQVIATSRTALHVYGEQVWRVPALPVPPGDPQTTAETLEQSEAADLFVQRARSVSSDFVVDDATAPAIAEICRNLDGLPLAIELAAARVNVLTPQGLLARLDSRLGVLTGGAQNLPPRQRTLREAIDWSYNLLDEREKEAYRRLSVFVRGFTLEAAEQVAGKGATLDLVSSLVDKSLLKQEEGPDGQTRFAMLETIREYGLERLLESGEESEVSGAHALAMVALAEEAEPHMTTGGRDPWLRKLNADLDNIRAALRWCLGVGNEDKNREAEIGLRLAGALGWYWYFGNRIVEGYGWVEQVLAKYPTQQTARYAKALFAAGALVSRTHRHVLAQPLLERSIEIFEAIGDKRGQAFALTELAVNQDRTNLAAMALTCERSISLFRSIGDKWGLSYALNFMGSILNQVGSFDAASKHLQEGLNIVKALRDETWIGVISLELGSGAMKQGKYDLAEAPLRASIQSATRSGDKWVTAFALRDLGVLLQHARNFETAGECYSSALDLFQELGANQLVATVILSQGILAQKKGDESQAARLYLESLALAGSLQIRSVVARCYIQFAGLASAHGQLDRAAVLIGAADAAYPILYNWLLPFEREEYDRLVGSLRARLGSSPFSKSRLAGRHYLPAQASAEVEALASAIEAASARSSRPQATSPTSYPAGLTKREVELLRLLDVGLSNAAIADRLLLSSNTVRAHLSSVYSKLNVTSRSAATHFAREHGLI